MKREKTRHFGLTILDLVLTALLAAAVLATVFHDQIHSFLQEEDLVRVEYTFVVENVTAFSVNQPSRGETLYELESQSPLGELTGISETSHTYANEDDVLTVSTLTCRASAEALNENGVLTVSGFKIKPGVTYTVTTASASFKMTIITVKTVDE